jgi:hypothetical protein
MAMDSSIYWLEVRKPGGGVGETVTGSSGTLDEVKKLATKYLAEHDVPEGTTFHAMSNQDGDHRRIQLFPKLKAAKKGGPMSLQKMLALAVTGLLVATLLTFLFLGTVGSMTLPPTG